MNKYLAFSVLAVLGGLQFLIVPIFSAMALAEKTIVFSLFVILLATWMLFCCKEWCFPKVLFPLVGLAFIFFISLFFVQQPFIGFSELYIFVVGLIFCFLVANLSSSCDAFYRLIFTWFQVIGLVVAILCFYQYLDWTLVGQRDTMLIPYLLPPGNARGTGIYGQSNLTALLLLVSIIAFWYGYAFKKDFISKFKGFCLDIGFLFVSIGFFLTGSRAGLLALLVALVVLLLLVYRDRIVFSNQSLLKVLVILLAGFFISQISLSSSAPAEMYTRSGVSIDARLLFWTASILMFIKAPFLGVGLDHFKLLLPSYARQAHDILGFVQYEAMVYTNWTHNEYLQILAESGIVGFVFLILFCILLLHLIYIEIPKAKQDHTKLFLFLMLLPFFIQGAFSWPFRHPPLFFIFLLILGISVAETPSLKFKFSRPMKFLLCGFLGGAVVILVAFTVQEYQFIQLKKATMDNGCNNEKIFSLLAEPHLQFKILREVLPLCLEDKSFLENQALVERFRPYFLKLTNVQGTHTQLYNLGVVDRALDDYIDAEAAFQKAVERQPIFELGWAALHALHIEDAARRTGRPIQDFLPQDKETSVDFYKLLSK